MRLVVCLAVLAFSAVGAAAASAAPTVVPQTAFAASTPLVAFSASGTAPVAARRGFGRPRSGVTRRATRRATDRRPVRRSRGGIGRSILRALGIAWLLSFLFGWGPGGGGPLGLLLLGGIVFLVYMMVRGSRRRREYAW